MDAIALAAGEIADALLLIGALQVERGDVGARRDLAIAELDLFLTARDLLPYRPGGVERVPALVDVRGPHRLPQAEGAAVGSLLPGDHTEQRRLARAVRPDDADDTATRQIEGEILD